jgi:hypothetical protein
VRWHIDCAFECGSVRDQPGTVCRSRGRRDQGHHRPGTDAVNDRRHLDARFIKNYCPVLEFGLVGQTMHQVDERTPVADLTTLTAVYRQILDRYFA